VLTFIPELSSNILVTNSKSKTKTSSSAAADRPRCRVVSFGQKWKTGTGRNKGYYAVQGNSRSSRFLSIESTYATFY